MKIQHAVNLLPYNTFKLTCIAEHFVQIDSIGSMLQLMKEPIYSNTEKKLIIGGGSNILLSEKVYAGLVINNTIVGKEIYQEDDESVILRVGGGENRDQFVSRSIEQGYYGIENLISIPGSVGAAPMQNIGAYGMEVSSVLVSVECIDLQSGSTVSFTKNECKLGYRQSVFKRKRKGKYMITHVYIQLKKYQQATYEPLLSYGAVKDKVMQKGETITPKLVADCVAEIRESKLPDRSKLGTAGSFFKNPIVEKTLFDTIKDKYPQVISFPVANPRFVKLSAGQLMDLAGCKGIQQGAVGTYTKHALILINNGGGTGDELISLATHIQKIVFDMFGVGLIPEVNYI